MSGDKHIIVSVHGIRTYGQWQERLKLLLLAGDRNIDYHTYTFGYFSILAFLVPPLRWLVVRKFRESLLRIIRKHSDARVDLVGHSFGTHIIAWTLLGTAPYLRPKIHTVILAGSVLRPSFPWQTMLDAGDIGRIVNDCGINDRILLLNQLTVLFTGMAGRIGLVGLTSDRLLNRFFKGGHSHYFIDSDGRQSDDFMARYWLPLLLFSQSAERVDERDIPTAWAGLLQTVIQNSEPIKMALYAAILSVPLLIYRQLYLNEKAARDALAAQNQENQRLYKVAQLEHVAAARQRDANLCALQWALNETLKLPLDQHGIDESKSPIFPLVGGIAERLIGSGFNGRIRIEGNTGKFCMDASGQHLAPPNSTECHFVREYDVGDGERLAQSLRRFLLLSGWAEYQISTVSYGAERPKYPYPKPFTTAGTQNAVAFLNSRVEIVFLQKNDDDYLKHEKECANSYRSQPTEPTP